MLKRNEVADPNSCFNKAGDLERVFVLLERDDAAPDVIDYWITKRIELGLNKPGDKKLLEAAWCAQQMRDARDRRAG